MAFDPTMRSKLYGNPFRNYSSWVDAMIILKFRKMVCTIKSWRRLGSQFLWIWIFLGQISSVFGQTLYSDDFSGYPPGTDGFPNWRVSKGFWVVRKGQFCENSGEFDAGAFLPVLINRSFELKARVRMLSSYKGAGLFFFSENPQKSTFAQMVRLDNEQVLMGYFQRANYQATQVYKSPVDLSDTLWHELRLIVSLEKKNYTLWIDNQIVGKPEPLRYFSGYLGLQNSGGSACFDDVALAPLPRTKPASHFSWPVAVANGPMNSLWVGSPAEGRVFRVNEKGKIIQRLRIGRKDVEPAAAPTAIASLPDGGIAVLDTIMHRIHRFSAEGNWLATAGKQLQRPVDLVGWPNGQLAVSDLAKGQIFFWDSSLKTLGVFQWPGALQPGVLAAYDSLFAFYDRATSRIHLFKGEYPNWHALAEFPAPSGQIRGMALTRSAIFVAADDRLEKMDFFGNRKAVLKLDMIGGIYPQRLAAKKDRIYIADFLANRVVVVDTAGISPAFHHRFTSSGRLVMEWQTNVQSPAIVEILPENLQNGMKLSAIQTGSVHKAMVNNLRPSTLYRIRYTPTVQMIPPDTGRYGQTWIMSPPPKGKMQYMELNGAVILFANIIDSAKIKPKWTRPPPLSEKEILRIRNQLEDGRRFYWLNSGMRLHLNLQYFMVDSVMERKAIFAEASYYPPKPGMVEKILQQQKADIAKFQAVFYIACIRDFDPKSQSWELRGRGGAFTEGIGANGKYGISWWEATHAWHPAGNNWLLVHEFHHQLDELFARSGFPGYWFNHFAPVAGNVADFGEHFDGNAYILRHWPEDRWFALKQARLRFSNDLDGDGIPDEDARLPMDEKRLGSRIDRRDSDGDGVPDLDELGFSNWIIEGQGEQYGKPAQLPNLNSSDTDHDGIPDKVDPYPLYPFKPVVARKSVGTNFSLVGATDDPRAPYRLWAAWQKDTLFFRLKLPIHRRIRLLLDANADGWFVGQDNLEFKLDNSDSLGASVNVFRANDVERWPFMDKHLAKEVKFVWKFLPGENIYELAIARNPTLGMMWESGEKMGLDIGVSAIMDEKGHEKNISIYEPNRFFNMVLQ